MPKHSGNGVVVQQLHEALTVSQIQARQLLHTAVDRKRLIQELEQELERKSSEVTRLELRLQKLEHRMLQGDGSQSVVAAKKRRIGKLERKLAATQDWLRTARQRGDKLLSELERKAARVRELELQLQCAASVGDDADEQSQLANALTTLRRARAAHRRLKGEHQQMARRLEELESRHQAAEQSLAERQQRISELERLVVTRQGEGPDDLSVRVEQLTQELERERARRRALELQQEQLCGEVARICRREGRPQGKVVEMPQASHPCLSELQQTLAKRDGAIQSLEGELRQANDEIRDYDDRLRQLKSRLEVSQKKADALRKKLFSSARLEHSENLLLREQEQRFQQVSGELDEARSQLEDERRVTRALRSLLQQHGESEPSDGEALIGSLEELLADRQRSLEELRAVASRREQKLRNASRVARDRQQEAQRLTGEIRAREDQIEHLSHRLADQSQRVQELEQAASQGEGRIQELEQRLWDKDNRIDDLSAVVRGQKNEIQSLEGLVDERGTRIQELERRDLDRGEKLSELERMVEVWEGKGHDLERLLSHRVARITELEELTEERATRVRELERLVAERNAVVSRLEQDLQQGSSDQGRLTELETQAAEMRGRLRDLDALCEMQGTELARWQDKSRELGELLELRQGQIEELEASLHEATQESSQAQQQLGSTREELDELEELLQDLDRQAEDRVLALEQTVHERSNHCQQLQSELADDQRKLEELRGHLAEREEQLADFEQVIELRDEHISELQQLLDGLESQDEQRLEAIRGLEQALRRERHRFQELHAYKMGERRKESDRVAELQNLLLISQARVKALETQVASKAEQPREHPQSADNETVVAVRDRLLQAQVRGEELEAELVQARDRLGEFDRTLAERDGELERLRQAVTSLEVQIKVCNDSRGRSDQRLDEFRSKLTSTQQELARTTLEQRAAERRRSQEREQEQAYIRRLKETSEVQAEELVALRSRTLEALARNETLEMTVGRLECELQETKGRQ